MRAIFSGTQLPLLPFYFHSRFRKWIAAFLIMLLVPAVRSHAQTHTDYAVHANIIYHFTKYINWPGLSKSGEFVIGIVGDSPIYDELKKMMSYKSVGNQRIVVKQFGKAQANFNCQILFITGDESNTLKKIAAKTEGEPVLLVCEEDGMALRGACINFTIQSQKLTLEINVQNIEDRQLNIANELLRLAKIVD
jgi:hypothetical protein